jgi:serine/threonine-protein kinase
MLEPQASRFWQATLHSGLMDVESLTVCWKAIPLSKRAEPEHIDRRLARQAVQSKALTIWQAQQLLAGRTGGFKVDRYVLLDLIGQGGMGRVYLALDTRLNRRVALKILSPERINNPRAIARFQREARVGAQLQHENLVRIYDFGESNGRFFLVMEYIEGKTIGTLISEQGPMPSATAVRLLRQVAMGLEHAHRKGLIHRDVNPYNILVTHDGTAKLADLGLALDLADEDRVTREGATVGTFDYVAPEQARQSHSADIRSDIYSLGCTFYHMISSQVPFPSPSLPEKLFSHQALEPTPLEQLVSGLPKGLTEVVQRMMRKSPDERYATPLQVAQALEPFTEEYTGIESQESTARHLQHPSLRPVPLSSDAAPRVETEAALALVKTVAEPSASKVPTVTGTNPGSEPDARADTVAVLEPGDGVQETEKRDPLALNLGPALLLSDGLSGSKSRSGSNHSALTADRVRLPAWLSRLSLWGIAALTVSVMFLVVMMVVFNPFGSKAGGRSLFSSGRILEIHPKMAPAPKSGANRPNVVQRVKAGIRVRVEGENEQGMPFENLLDAMHTAIGSNGWVELGNSKPLHVRSDQAFDFRTARGLLRVSAAPGSLPVIEFELKGPKPLFDTGSAVTLQLSGLSIVVRYPQAGLPTAPSPPAVITAAGAVKIDRCAFISEGGLRLKETRAIASNGGALEVDRSWFQGFDKVIELSDVDRKPTQIRETMFVSGPAQSRGQPPELCGWSVSVRSNRPRGHLILERCTVEGAGLLDLVTKRKNAPLQIEVRNCVLRTDALLACEPGTVSREQIQKQICWQGQSNQYSILGRSWIVLSANQERTPAFSAAVTDLDSWSQVAVNESKPILAELKYLVDPTARKNPLRPRDFAIAAPGSKQTKPGADPDRVGPWSNP